VVVEESLFTSPKMKALLEDDDVVQIVLLGATEPKGKRKSQLIYAVVARQPKAKIVNILSMAVYILQSSRRVILGIFHRLLSLLDMRLVSANYSDTDSLILGSTFKDLRECLKVRTPETEAELASLMLDETALVSQHGKLQLEGRFTIGRFRSAKSYLLGGEEETTRRMKGISRAVQALLTENYFEQDVRTNVRVVRSRALRPTKCGEIMMLEETRTMMASFNLKAKAIVSRRW